MATYNKLDTIGKKHKSDDMKGLKTMLEKATNGLIAAQKANDTARAKKWEEKIAEIKGTIQRNS